MTVVLGPTETYEQRDKLVTLQWSGLWDVRTRYTYLTPDSVLRDRRQK